MMIDRIRRALVRRWTRLTMPFKYETEDVSWCWCGRALFPVLRWNRRKELVTRCFCGTGVLRRRLTEASYQKWYASGDYRRYVTGSARLTEDQFSRAYRRGVEIWTFLEGNGCVPKTVVEIGAGSGGILSAFSRHGACEVLGYDVDPQAKAFAATRGIHVILPDETVPDSFLRPDVILLSHVLEHLYDPLVTLALCRRATGHIYIQTPAWTDKTEAQLPHLWYFTSDSFRVLMKRAGLEIVAITDGIQAVLRRN